MKRVSKVFLIVFSVGVLLTALAGALSFLGFVAALILGGETATAICVFIHKEYFPWVIQICSISVGFGLIGMYLNKMKALAFSEEKKENK